MRSLFSAAPLLGALALSGCTSMERIHQNMNSSEATDAKARQQIQKLTSPSPVLREAPRQWINPTPMMDRKAIKKATPPCTITLNRKGALSLHEVSERITRVCRLPVSVTPDALTLLGGVSGGQTQQMTGDIPPPEVNGMVPLSAIGRASFSAPAAVHTGTTLNGLYWNGPLAGLLDTIASRLGVSWRYESGQIVIYALETRSMTLNFMDSQTDYHSRVVSGTTSKSGQSGGQSGDALSGNATTSQSTSTLIRSSLYADLQGAVTSMLTPGLGRLFLSAGNLTVTDVPRVLDTVARFVDERNQTLNRQVVLNIEVLSVEARQKDQMGLDWNSVFNNSRLGLSLSQAFGGVSGNIMQGGFSVVDGRLAGSKVFLKALAEQARVSVVTQQSSTTTNLSPIAMQVAEQEDYVAQVTTQTTTNVGTATSIQPATMTTGFYIHLLPNILPDGQHLLLQFAINLSDPPTRRTFTSGESSVELLNTQLKTFTQRVKMKTGQTLVLSGFQQTSLKAENRASSVS
ncbi:PilN family type IVB pilus formation outer membrane protein [Candidatus Hamiltonella defensa]|uniref:PilN family type IVB pilus formation outer membrane protein n=1 Tax=Candidatus Williamhamiltonella defendens TaxID=138072 RepID=UPI001F3C2131|nr:PilN family type IVB pilus formation outer membrane protein [Candidatus Hamiltonella defensa]